MFKSTLSSRLEKIPTNQLLRLYICGPTVYNSAHLGHARTYITFDIIRSLLERVYHNEVVYQMNITDIDDKIINRSNELGVAFTELARKYEEEFFCDLRRLNVRPPTVVTRVTEYLPSIVAFIQKIMDNGYAYASSGSVYFDTVRFSQMFTYPKLRIFDNTLNTYEALNNAEGASMRNRIDEKHSPSDFALWKAAKPGEPSWDSQFGAGRPGWHIECSVMSNECLIQRFGGLDMHFGGKDLQFPHHANEIAQIEAYLGREVLDHEFHGESIKAFLHSGHLRINDEIMSKSKMNFRTIRDVLGSYTANYLRVLFLQVPYASDINYSLPQLDNAVALEQKLVNFLRNCEQFGSAGDFYAHMGDEDFALLQAMVAARYALRRAYDDDFDYPSAFKQITAFVDRAKQYMQGRAVPNVVHTAGEFVREELAILGFSAYQYYAADDLPLQLAQALAQFRADIKGVSGAQNSEIIAKCDEIRDKVLPPLGFQIEDAQEATVKKIDPQAWQVQQARIAAEKEEKAQRAKAQREAREAKLRDEMQLAKIRAEDMFRGDDTYTYFDENGIPQKMKGEDGVVCDIPKSRAKKLQKEWEARKKLNEKYAE